MKVMCRIRSLIAPHFFLAVVMSRLQLQEEPSNNRFEEVDALPADLNLAEFQKKLLPSLRAKLPPPELIIKAPQESFIFRPLTILDLRLSLSRSDAHDDPKNYGEGHHPPGANNNFNIVRLTVELPLDERVVGSPPHRRHDDNNSEFGITTSNSSYSAQGSSPKNRVEHHPFWQQASALLDPLDLMATQAYLHHSSHSSANSHSNSNSSSQNASHGGIRSQSRVGPYHHFRSLFSISCLVCRINYPSTNHGLAAAKRDVAIDIKDQKPGKVKPGTMFTTLLELAPLCKEHDKKRMRFCGLCLRDSAACYQSQGRFVCVASLLWCSENLLRLFAASCATTL
ncbi:hypothetical protein C8J56DRAFT_1053332 [Mycena floridula]|nr:hypothetical protein C8J56DRAFT_1053332 [Mycena floridula]